MTQNIAFEARYRNIRSHSEALCAPLSIEDYVVQPAAEVSPPKWHLAHTTWFFEQLFLKRFVSSYVEFDTRFAELFNSYYKGLGPHWAQADRGHLSRPTVAEVVAYRAHVDENLREFLKSAHLTREAESILELGFHHEQQHQELLLMDIKRILGMNPIETRYSEKNLPASVAAKAHWKSFEEGLRRIGFEGRDFSFDNERPSHAVFLQPFTISTNLVTNGEFAEFIRSGAYSEPKLWLSLGWDWVQRTRARHPMYWREDGGEYTLHGWRERDPHSPVAHVNYFEADAFARWSQARLPTEAEFECAAPGDRKDLGNDYFHAIDAAAPHGQLWCWTQSSYAAYPGFRPFHGSVQEYNGKFMCNQYVLRGGCVATPPGHYRDTYRNFYLPEQQWMFSGIRLARDLQ